MYYSLLDYEPCSTFELRPSNTTKTGGKTLLCPTPYAVKMALLDRIICYYGEEYGRQEFEKVRDLKMFIQPPLMQVVNRTFQAILRSNDKKEWIETIALREFCVQVGLLHLAIGTTYQDFADLILKTAATINYFGQRGSFYQLVSYTTTPNLPSEYIDMNINPDRPQMGFLQYIDDMQEDATFDDVSALHSRNSSGARQHKTIILPYQIVHHAHNHTVLEYKR